MSLGDRWTGRRMQNMHKHDGGTGSVQHVLWPNTFLRFRFVCDFFSLFYFKRESHWRAHTRFSF